MRDAGGGMAALHSGREQQVAGALEVLVGAVSETAGRTGSAPPSGPGLVTGQAALLLRATEGLARDPGVGAARVRLAEAAAAVLDGDVLGPVLDDTNPSHTLALGWLHDAIAGPANRARDRAVGAELERAWIRAVWGEDYSGLDDERLLALSALGRPIDTLCPNHEDLYALTRAVLVATDVGQRRTPARVTVGEAEAALALALDADDLTLAAEVLWLWPMLDLVWTPPAEFALELVDAHDDDSLEHAWSYGVLCAVLAGRRVRRPAHPARGPVLPLPAPGHLGPRWSVAYQKLSLADRSALAPVVLTVVVRRAYAARDVAALRTAVNVAVDHGLLDSPAASQAAALLRRNALRASADALAG